MGVVVVASSSLSRSILEQNFPLYSHVSHFSTSVFACVNYVNVCVCVRVCVCVCVVRVMMCV